MVKLEEEKEEIKIQHIPIDIRGSANPPLNPPLPGPRT